MITRLVIRNFKRFGEADIPLGSPVVLVGPNNSGKTSALQALALWELGLRRWIEKRGGNSGAKQRVGVVLNRRDLVQLPVPTTALLWLDLHLRQVPDRGAKATQNILIEIAVEGISNGKAWRCPLEFDYSNNEIIHCRPARVAGNGQLRATIPPEAEEVHVAYLPPMSGLTSNERRIDEGAINVSLGEGQTAQVLRNLCWILWDAEHDKPAQGEWGALAAQIKRLFGVELDEPEYVTARGEIQMSYREPRPNKKPNSLDLSAAGRGLQQTLLLLAFLRWKPRSVLLIDEPDAHLEILRQRQIFLELTETARQLGSQLIIATHSEVVLNEAEREQIIAFVGKPHLLRQESELRKALVLLGYEQFLQAEISGWVLYLEGSTDLESLRVLSRIAFPKASEVLEHPFVVYVQNQIDAARQHFYGLREAYTDLKGIAIFDNTPDVKPKSNVQLKELKWSRKELENYFCQPFLLRRWVEKSDLAEDLFGLAELERRRQAMDEAIRDNTAPVALNDPQHVVWKTIKSSDDYLPVIFGAFFQKLGLPNSMNRSDYRELAGLLRPEEVDPEIVAVLQEIMLVANSVPNE